MLFNSFEFILLFLPLTLLVYRYLLSRSNKLGSMAWLVSASLFFYGWWNPAYLALITLSVGFNYLLGLLLARHPSRLLLTLGVGGNLFAIGYFKYAGFLVFNLGKITGSDFTIETIALPLAISFFTFQQIAYLVDIYRGLPGERHPLKYALFVLFFPQLIAGPIVHHREMLPQFTITHKRSFDFWFATGLTIFVIGLFKKVIIADNLALYATPVFEAASNGTQPLLLEAWGGALAYTFQLYFDFSGYSDMAIGLARLFGIALPFNFASPYQATSIIEFWRRWHMTLSRFLKDYLYVPLGGNQRGRCRRYVNLLITMLLGGLWHGAGWTFVAWGGLHGFYLIINHGWRRLKNRHGEKHLLSPGWQKALSVLITFLAVVVAWVFFRADSFSSAIALLRGMAGLNGILVDAGLTTAGEGVAGLEWGYLGSFGSIQGFLLISLSALLVWGLPNTQQIVLHSGAHQKYGEDTFSWRHWSPNGSWSLLVSILALASLMHLHGVSEFLYFNF